MKLFNYGAVALLATLPLGTAVNTSGQTWEVEIMSAEEQFDILIGNLASEYIEYAEAVNTWDGFATLVKEIQVHHPNIGVDVTDHYNTNFASLADPHAAIVEEMKSTYFEAAGFEKEDLTVAYLGTSIDKSDFGISSSYDENMKIIISNPLREIDRLSYESTLIHSASLPKIGQEYGDPLITFDEGKALDPTEEFLVDWLAVASNHTASELQGSFSSHLYNENLFGFSEYRSTWTVGIEFSGDRQSFIWNYSTISNLSIVPVEGSSAAGLILFTIPMLALFGPLVAKKVTDHKMKKLVKKGGA